MIHVLIGKDVKIDHNLTIVDLSFEDDMAYVAAKLGTNPDLVVYPATFTNMGYLLQFGIPFIPVKSHNDNSDIWNYTQGLVTMVKDKITDVEDLLPFVEYNKEGVIRCWSWYQAEDTFNHTGLIQKINNEQRVSSTLEC